MGEGLKENSSVTFIELHVNLKKQKTICEKYNKQNKFIILFYKQQNWTSCSTFNGRNVENQFDINKIGVECVEFKKSLLFKIILVFVNQIGDLGASSIGEAIKDNSTLVNLCLGEKQINIENVFEIFTTTIPV